MPYTVITTLNVPNGVAFGDANPDKIQNIMMKLNSYVGNGLESFSLVDKTDTATMRTSTYVYTDETSYNKIMADLGSMPEIQDRINYNTANNITVTVNKTAS